MSLQISIRVLLAVILMAGVFVGCGRSRADLILLNGRVYTLAWGDPGPNGEPAADAPPGGDGWRPDGTAIAIRAGRIDFIGSDADARRRQGTATQVHDLAGATVVPGLIDSHVHLAELGASLERVNLVGVQTPEEAIERVAERAAQVPAGDWIVGWGWDEGAWASRYPDMRELSARVPNHPVVLRGLHSFAVWGNQLAFDRANITASTQPPPGGEIRKDAAGRPTGILTNQAGDLVMRMVPAPTPAQLDARLRRALATLAAAGYVAVHEAGADSALVDALTRIDAAEPLPVRVVAYLAARDTALIDAWRARGPWTSPSGALAVRGVKAFYDGAMGSRGAFLLGDYSDSPGHRGTGGAEYGFDAARMAGMMRAGFQLMIHAIGDRANREALDLIGRALSDAPDARRTRPRIEHAQVLHPSDVPRFAQLGVIASMQPSHAVEDMAWAEDRIGAERLAGAYAWRSIRRAGGRLTLNSDLPGTDYNFFYGLHSAVTRRDRSSQPEGGWRPQERLTIDEAMRGWTRWAAWAGFEEERAGVIGVRRPADLTVLSLDPFSVGDLAPARLLNGQVLMTLSSGRVVYTRR